MDVAGTYLSSPSCVATELGDQSVAVTAVDRADILDDLALARAGRPLEQERRRVERYAEILGLFFIRHSGLDRLEAADDVDAIAVGQQRVEGVILEILGGKAGNERGADVQ